MLVRLSVHYLVMDLLVRQVHVGGMWHDGHDDGHGTHDSQGPLRDGTILVDERSESGSRWRSGKVSDICSAQTQSCRTVRLHRKYPM